MHAETSSDALGSSQVTSCPNLLSLFSEFEKTQIGGPFGISGGGKVALQ